MAWRVGGAGDLRGGLGRARGRPRAARRGGRRAAEIVLARLVTARRVPSRSLGVDRRGGGRALAGRVRRPRGGGPPRRRIGIPRARDRLGVPVFAGVGALASQLAPTRRVAPAMATGALVVALVLRVVADTSASAAGCAGRRRSGGPRSMRPFTGARPLVLLPPLAASAGARVAPADRRARDVGAGLIAARDERAPGPACRRPTAHALRASSARCSPGRSGSGCSRCSSGSSRTASAAGISDSLRQRSSSSVSPIDRDARRASRLTFLFFVLAISLFAAAQMRRPATRRRLSVSRRCSRCR